MRVVCSQFSALMVSVHVRALRMFVVLVVGVVRSYYDSRAVIHLGSSY